MIAALRGTVLRTGSSLVVIDVHGVGYAVQVTPQHALLLHEGQEVSLVTSLIVREDSLTLFGFETIETLEVFSALLGVNGVGPRSALAVLSELTAGEVAAAVANEDDKAFRKVSGIGPKTAKLIVVSLAGKLFAAPPAAATQQPERPDVRSSVLSALVGLGWPERTASDALDSALESATDGEAESVPLLLRKSLTLLGPASSGQGR